MNKSESKYFNTANRIDEAFISLLDKKDFESITVKEICQKAGVNRSTFYLHYDTTDDLLMECNEYAIKKFLNSTSGANLTHKDIDNLSIKELNFVTPEHLVPWLKFIKNNKSLFKTYFYKFSNLVIEKNNKLLFSNIANPIFDKLKVAENSKKYYFQFHLEGIMAIVKLWVKNNCKEEIEEICNIIMGCMNCEKTRNNVLDLEIK